MQLTNYLKEQGYDLIGGPIRNHKLAQLWVKKTFDEVELYYSHINHAFSSELLLEEVINPALNVNQTAVNNYNFNIGMTILDTILKSIGLNNFEISAIISGGKKIAISYDESITKEIPSGEIANYFYAADFLHPNPDLLRNANRNNIIVISGIVFAKNLLVEIEADHSIDSKLLADFSGILSGKVALNIVNQRVLKMSSMAEVHFPIAVKANRLQFQKGKFTGLKLITDDRDLF